MESKTVIALFCVFSMAELTVVRGIVETKSKDTCGSPCVPGVPGVPGPPGNPGNPGRDGMPGSPGAACQKLQPEQPKRRGKEDPIFMTNWKQCSWKRVDHKDSGLIQNCNFLKKYDNTSLRVSYEANQRVYGGGVCNRWYFTFNGVHCKNPETIEGAVFVASTAVNTNRHGRIEGYCHKIRKGRVSVGIRIGWCEGIALGNAESGWGTASRIVIQEMAPPQT